jgi:RNA polymerase sigma factor (TIGR02999 family)
MSDIPSGQSNLPKRVTELLKLVRAGNDEAKNRLAETIYHELRQVAANRLKAQPNSAIRPTELVDLAYERLLENGKLDATDRRHLFAIFKRAMRDVLVEQWRERNARKRGAGRPHVPLVEIPDAEPGLGDALPDLLEALDRLEALHPEEAEIVSLKFLCGLTVREIAQMTQSSPATVQAKWENARRWLYSHLQGEPPQA